MWKVLAITTVLLYTIIVQSKKLVSVEDHTKDKLIFAHVVYRHGNRTPLVAYDTDPWKDQSNWARGWGEITNIGKRTHYYLGQWLRNRYKDLIGETYSGDEIYVQSTEVDRVLMSALSNLAGLYPPSDRDLWLPNIHWQPIPVHQIPKPLDDVIAGTKSCPKFLKLKEEYLQSDVYQGYLKSIEPVLKYANSHSKMELVSAETIYDLYSCLDIEHEHGFELPEWTSKVYPEPLKSICGEMFRYSTNTTAMTRLRAGPIIKEILTRFQQKVDNTLVPSRNLWMYSGHDISVVNLLNGLGLFKPHNPPFAACVMVELRMATRDSPYVSVFYKTSNDEPELLDIPNCGPRCPLERMFELYKDIIPEDWEQECQI
ncbi:prostatic acid phosphatase [Aedes albopictus]|uniref:acid phosphatase n=1 Tax=Aedes albopictus TaxID=7160 RepID=A0ABM1Y6T2_AEDAL|nr:prostatic acid phosphatase-like [Aedes albopictus]